VQPVQLGYGSTVVDDGGTVRGDEGGHDGLLMDGHPWRTGHLWRIRGLATGGAVRRSMTVARAAATTTSFQEGDA
jgi:hypothetical protein